MRLVNELIAQCIEQLKDELKELKQGLLKFKNVRVHEYINGIKSSPHNSLVLFLLILSVVILYIFVVITNGMCFDDLLFFNNTDPLADLFMDYINPVRSLFMKNPYTQINAMYPPITYIILQFFGGWLSPDLLYHDMTSFIGIDYSLLLEGRNNNQAMISVLLYSLITVVIFIVLVKFLFKKYNLKHGFLISALLICSFPFLYALQRGNVVLISLNFLLFYFYAHDHKNVLMRELSLISLAIVICLKIYPVFFVLLLLSEKKYAKTFRLVIYCAFIFFFPFIFYGGFSAALAIFKNVFSITNMLSDYYPTSGFSINKSLYLIQLLLNNEFYVISVLKDILPNLLILVGSACVFFHKKPWKKVLLITSIFLLFPSQSMIYNAVFYILPIILFFSEKEKTKFDYVYVFLLVFCIFNMPYTVIDIRQLLGVGDGANVTISFILLCFSSLVITALLIGEGIYNAFNAFIKYKLKLQETVTAVFYNNIKNNNGFNLKWFLKNKSDFLKTVCTDIIILIAGSMFLGLLLNILSLNPLDNLLYYISISLCITAPALVMKNIFISAVKSHDKREIGILNQSLYGLILSLIYSSVSYLIIIIFSLTNSNLIITINLTGFFSIIFACFAVAAASVIILLIINLIIKSKRQYKYYCVSFITLCVLLNITLILNPLSGNFTFLLCALNPLYSSTSSLLYIINPAVDFNVYFMLSLFIITAGFLLLFIYSLRLYGYRFKKLLNLEHN